MGMLLTSTPFIVFAVIDRLVGPTAGLVAGAAVSLGLIARDAMTQGRSAKIVEIGTAQLFGGLAVYAVLASPSSSVIEVRLWVDAGLLAIVLNTMLIGRPFTLQYAREQIAVEHHGSPEFVRAKYIISGA